MKKAVLFFLLALCLIKCQGQGTIPPANFPYDSTAPKMIFYANLDSLDASDLDTIPVFILYVDTTQATGSKTIKVNGLYKFFTYKLPVDPKTYWKKGFAVFLKQDASAMALPNDHTGEFEYIGFVKYLDEIKQPFAKKYLVMYTKGYGYDYMLPPAPEETMLRGF
jgi:hypothetical protein